MRNTTMKDALAEILAGGASAPLENQSDEAVLSAVGATRRKLTKQSKKAKPSTKPAGKKRSKNFDLSSEPANRPKINPFSIDASPEKTLREESLSDPAARRSNPATPLIPKDAEAIPALSAREKEQDPAPARVLDHFEPNARALESNLAFEEQKIRDQRSENRTQTKIETLVENPAAETAPIEVVPIDAAPKEEDNEEEEPAPVLPSNLEWLKKPTPFSAPLATIVDKLRDARQRVIFTLSQLQARQKEYRRQLDEAEYGIEEQKEKLKTLDDTISACALVAEQSASLKADLFAGAPVHHKHTQNKAGKTAGDRHWSLIDPALCHQRDVVEFFEANSNTNWTPSEIAEAMPAAKQTHAKSRINQILFTLQKAGVIQRVGSGIYRMDRNSGQQTADSGQ